MCAWTRTLIGGASSVGAGSPATFTTLSLTADTAQVVLDSDGTNPVTLTIVAPTAPRTISLPNATDTLVGKATADTLTNKTLTAPVIASIVNTGTLTLPTATDTLVARTTTDTLTNKTLTSPTISAPTLSGAATVSGGGTLTLAADPAAALQAATKQYVDAVVAFKDTQTTTVDVQNTVTETNLYSVSIPQNILTAGRNLELILWGDRLENAVGTLTIRVKFGATTLFTSPASDVANSASRQIHYLRFDLFASAANSQVATLRWLTSATGANGPFALGTALNFIDSGIPEGMGENTSTEDNGAGAKTLAVTAQWSAASPSLSVRALGVKTLVFG